MIEGGKSPPNGRGLGKRARGMLGSRVGGECMLRGNGESITANEGTSRHTNDPGTHRRTVLSVYRTLEVYMYPHV